MNARALCRQHSAPYLRPSAGRERLAGIGGALLLALLLTACGGGGDDDEAGLQPEPPMAAPTVPTPRVDCAAHPEACR